MPKIEISQESLNWLKNNMNTKEYSVEQVVDRLIEDYKKEKAPKPSGRSGKTGPEKGPVQFGRVYRPRLRGGKLSSRLPDLTHSKIVSAQVNGRPVKNNWNPIRAKVFAATGSVQALKKLPYKTKRERGDMGGECQYIPELDLSVPNSRAKYACRDAVHAALLYDIKLDIQFSRRGSSKKARIVVGDS